MPPFEYESRRSGRKRVKNSRYNNETFTSLDSPDELEKNPTTPQQELEAESDSDDFVVTERILEREGGVDLHNPNVSNTNAPLSESDSDVDTVSGRGVSKSVTATPRQPRRFRNLERSDVPEVRTTGVVLNTSHRLSKRRVVSFLAGNSEPFNKALISALDIWGRYPTIPLRNSCLETSPFATHSEGRSSLINDWSWYHQYGGDKSFDEHQPLTAISEVQHLQLSNSEAAFSKHVLIAHDPHEKVYRLNVGESVELSRVEASAALKLSSLSGCWLVNSGWPVCSLSWAWSGLGHEQFLAVATSNRNHDANTYPETELPFFAKQSSIQVWRVKGKPLENQRLGVDATVPPSLCLSIFSDIGAVKSIKWCPFPQTIAESTRNKPVFLGLLAVVHVGGEISVLRILIDGDSDTPRRVFKPDKLAFFSRPNDTKCTCVTWVSNRIIVAGCANGYIMAWDIYKHVSRPTHTPNAVPIFSHPAHTSHVLDIVACAPSRPHLVITSSVNGNIRLTSLRAPFTDYVLSQRSRFGHSSISWHEQTQHALLFDEASMIFGVNIRKFTKRTHVGRSEAQPFYMATSPIHASVLAGNTDGSVFVFNPMARLFDTAPDLLQPWFQHQWRRKKEIDQLPTSSNQNPSATNLDHPRGERHQEHTDTEASCNELHSPSPKNDTPSNTQFDFPTGISRIVKGFKPSRFIDTSLMLFEKNGETTVSGAARPESKNLVQGMVVEEAATGVYSLGWNPTSAAGGWAAAGLGNGLVLIEDLCYDP